MTIKELREKLGWSREKMASELGVSYFSLQNWELGNNQPSPMARRRIEEITEKYLKKEE